jgi:localization factor PodJL
MRATPATDVNRTRARARDKSVTRLSILEAARRLASAKGIEKLTLADVATEAGMARATVYGYFKSRDELMQAVVSDDLTMLSNMVPDVEWPEAVAAAEPAREDDDAVEADEAAEAAPVETAPQVNEPASLFNLFSTLPESARAETFAAVEARDAEETQALDALLALVPQDDAPVSQDDIPAVEEAEVTETAVEAEAPAPVEAVREPETPVLLSAPDDFRVEQKVQLDSILARLTPNDPPNSEGSAATLARYDRRLRVVERTITEMQTQHQQVEKSATGSNDTVMETLRGMTQRLEESERRQREAFADLRASAREAARRLDALEGGKSAAPETPVEDFVPGVVVVPEEPVTKTDEEIAAEAEAKASVTYLSNARASARAALDETKVAAAPKPWWMRIPKKYLMVTCAMMSAVVFVVGVLVVQRASAIAARADTISPAVMSRAVAHRPQRLAVVGPLDELSALAASGNGKAQLLIGLKYLKGDGAEKNPVEAAKWIGKAAQRGEPMAQYWAGYVYQHGIGVSADPDEAMRWYESSAEQGNTKAMYNLGVGYAQGWTGAKDTPEAGRWFARAARLGFLDAQFNLAVLYERGEGVPASLVDAYKWYAVAAKSGDAESKKRLEAIATQLNSDDLSAAQRSAMMFKPTPIVPEANAMPVVELKRG